ncbi:Hypothetical Protein FCC1311_076822 [Hondaea fermentalgiana]|uniref:Uncharacterized protein n=1 Tax=Hondaea fermentalgiana TaxID=2315210 RepID=A0A2R5GNX5_9STRA|nr:Hypothetical Protein FCC1311_076822 [Hondaea fermentalgiana]|eukprot:GBG31458.1 Hypothetical Protein FCC1311_076822 [Hondaea fermentalgiana]
MKQQDGVFASESSLRLRLLAMPASQLHLGSESSQSPANANANANATRPHLRGHKVNPPTVNPPSLSITY